MNPGKTVPANIRYELRVQPGPTKIQVAGATFDVAFESDIAVIVRVVTSDSLIIEEKVVGVVGDEYRSGISEFLRLSKFLNSGGVIGLHRDLVY